MTLANLRDLYLTILPNVYHYEADAKTNKYIVWAEDGQGNSVHANNKTSIQVIQGTTDYFTKDEFDPNFNLIQEKMNDAGIAWSLNSIQLEDDTKYIHYEWVWEVENSIG